MASTFTDLGLELMATGENAGTWGTKTNANLSLIEQLTGGVLSLAVAGSGTTALTISDGALTGTAQQRVIELTGALTGSRILTFPLLTETFYIIKNGTTNAQTVQLKAASGSGATVTFATDDKGYKLIYLDGVATNTGVFEATIGSTAANSITTAMIQNSAVTTAKIADDNVTVAKMADNSVDSAQYVDGSIDTVHIANDQITNALMADNAIDTAQIAASAVETAKINNDAVTADKLANTSVTAGSYNTANITVDAQGRLTAASAGAGGDGSYFPRLLAGGPSSGNFATPANAGKFYAFAQAGGGGGGGGTLNAAGGAGAVGGFGLFSGNVAAGTTFAFSVGAQGNGGATQNGSNGTAGGAGGATNINGLFTVNAGNGGNGGPRGAFPSGTPGSAGNAPGSNSSLPTGNWLAGGNVTAGGNAGARQGAPGGDGGPGSLTFYDDGGQ